MMTGSSGRLVTMKNSPDLGNHHEWDAASGYRPCAYANYDQNSHERVGKIVTNDESEDSKQKSVIDNVAYETRFVELFG